MAWVANYFQSRATLRHYYCLVGYISVKTANFKLKKFQFAGQMWPPPSLWGHRSYDITT